MYEWLDWLENLGDFGSVCQALLQEDLPGSLPSSFNSLGGDRGQQIFQELLPLVDLKLSMGDVEDICQNLDDAENKKTLAKDELAFDFDIFCKSSKMVFLDKNTDLVNKKDISVTFVTKWFNFQDKNHKSHLV